MELFSDYLAGIEPAEHRDRVAEVLNWAAQTFPTLKPKIAWNQPMFTDHGTYIIGLSVARHHMAVAPEKVVIQHFSEQIKKSGYDFSKELIRIPWDSPIDFSLLDKIIRFNILDKAECQTFWRKQ